jgi:2,3-bisphosphoglycerate-independent phosphoglycerate mutase
VKYVIIIPDGAADLPIPELGDRTPFEAARMPNLARLAEMGRVGVASTTPPGFEAGSDVCSMSLLGYDPVRYHTGRAPLEAAALGLQTGPRDFIFRLNFVTTGQAGTPSDGLMLDHSAGAITDREARVLVNDLLRHWRSTMPSIAETIAIYPGVSYRNIVVDTSGRDYAGVLTTPPHAIPGESWRENMPEGGAADSAQVLCKLMLSSAEFLPTHEVNLARKESGLRMATMAWIWGQGVRPTVPSFRQRFGLRGAMITSVDLLAGIASYIGWDRLPVPGLTSYHDTDYAGQGRATCEAIETYDVVCSHVEAPDEASHQGDWKTKVASLERIDEAIIGPVMERLRSYGDPEKDAGAEGWRVLVMPDHYTLCSTRKHDATPVPFAMAGAWIRSAVRRRMIEREAAQSDLRIDDGHELMEYFLRGGLAAVKVR